MTDDKINISLTATDGVSQVLHRVNGNLTSLTTISKKVRGSFTAMKVDTETFGNSAENAGKSTKGLNSALAKTGVGLMVVHMAFRMAVQKIKEFAQWVGESIKAYREFEKNIAEVSTILAGEGIKGFEVVGSEIERLSITFGKSANDLAQGMYDILSAAFDVQSGMRLLEVATKAAIAGITDVSTSVDVFTSILNAWGLEASRAAEISDQLFQTVVRGKLRFEELANAMGYIAPIAANLGVEFKEIAAALSTVTRQGQHVDMATRGLALMIQNVADLTPVAAQAAEKYAVDLSSVALRAGGLEYIINDLNRAMKEHGSQILPEMIRNMRAFRVAVALAGDIGVQGFIRDLNLLEHSQGRTEEAMRKMMATSQQEADIIDQTMELIERRVGEAWHSFDIGWKKVKMWWGALFAGEDASQMVRDYEQSVNNIRIAAAEMIEVAIGLQDAIPLADIIDIDFSQYDTLEDRILKVQEAVSEGFNLDNVKKYFTLEEEIGELAKVGHELYVTKTQVQGLEAELDNLRLSFIAGTISKKELTQAVDEFNTKVRALDLGTEFEVELPDDVHLKRTVDNLRLALIPYADLVKELTGDYDENESAIANLQTVKAKLAESETEFTGAIDGSRKAIQEHQETIVTLQRAIEELEVAVERTYTTMEGTTFAGTDYWEATTRAMDVALDRFTRYADMTMKYGDEMKTGYMQNIQNLAGQYENLDNSQLEALGSLEWYNKEIFDGISGIDEFDGSMVEVLDTIGRYNQLMKEAKDVQAAHRVEMDASRKKMLELSLAMMQIQLVGMMRRRGLTRTEEKKIQQIRIEQTRERIKQMEMELQQRQEIEDMGISELELQAGRAQAIYEEYVDRVKFELTEMKDTQDDELNNFLAAINLKELRLTRYRALHTKEVAALSTALVNYQALLGIIASDEQLEEQYRTIYGLNVLEEALSTARQLKQFGKDFDITAFDDLPTAPEVADYVKSRADMSSTQQILADEIDKRLPSDRARDIFHRSPFGKALGFARGTYSVPKEGLYHLHGQEQVVPAGSNTNQGEATNITINVTGNTIAEGMEKRIASEIASAVQRGLMNSRTGKTKYRRR